MRKHIQRFTVFLSLIFILFACTETQKATYVIAFDSNGGSVVANISVTSGQSLNLPTPTREGYDFLGWYINPNDESTKVTQTNTITKNTLLVAKWSSKGIVVTFDGQGGTLVTGELTYTFETAGTLNTPPVFNKEGYTFAGWYLNSQLTGDPVAFPLSINQSLTLYAKWNQGGFTIIFDGQGGTLVTGELTYTFQVAGTLNTPPVFAKDGHTFSGWYDNSRFTGSPMVFPLSVDKGQTLYAKWEEASTITDGTSFDTAPLVQLDVIYTITLDFYDVKYVKFIPTVTGYYYFETYGNSDTYGKLYNQAQEVIGNNDDGGSVYNFKIGAQLIAGNTYYVSIEMYDSSTEKGTVEFKVYKDTDSTSSGFDNAIVASLNVNYSIFIDLKQQIYYKFTPQVSGTYTFKTVSEFDTYGRLYNQLYELLIYNDDGGDDYNFMITYSLVAGQTYYIQFEMFFMDTDSGTVNFIINKID
jgi:uncharacterized repeat protein (TIGR02543 family)